MTREDVEDRSATFSEVEAEDQVAAMLGGQQSVGGVVSDTVGTTQQVMTSSSSHRRYVLLDIFLIFYALAECIVMTVVTFTTAHFLECFNFLFLLVFPSNFSCI